VSLPLLKSKSVKQPAKFAKRNDDGRVARARPLERSAFQTTVQQPETILLPIEHFEFVALAIAKHKQAGPKRIEVKALLNQ
jgi:hypothetical protein